MYPEIQRKAQAEVDRVIGRDRLPNFTDEPSLPYVAALVKEVLRSVCSMRYRTLICILLTSILRWRPVTPLGQYLLLLHNL